ncbi:U2 snRNP component prp10, partial [Coemansia sp. RSA 2336]
MDNHDDIKAQLEAERQKRKQLQGGSNSNNEIKYDTDLYETGDKFAGYDKSIEPSKEIQLKSGRFGITAPRELLDELQEGDEDVLKELQRERGIQPSIGERESDYQKRRHDRQLPGEDGGFAEKMRLVQLDNERKELEAKISRAAEKQPQQQQQRRRWDQTPADIHKGDETPVVHGEATPRKRSRWDQTPADVGGDQTPAGIHGAAETPRRSRWDQTPQMNAAQFGETPKRTRSRWDETPAQIATATPKAAAAAAISSAAASQDPRNAFQTDEELDALLPEEGYEIVEAPASYMPIRTPARKLMATPAPQVEGFQIPEQAKVDLPAVELGGVGALPFLKEADVQAFGRLLEKVDENDLSATERKEREVLELVLRIKNGTQPQRKAAMRAMTERARELGADAIFGQVLPLLMSAHMEDHERHVLVKVVGRALQRLGAAARGHVHRILVAVEPLLIDTDRYARAEGHEIVSSLSKAVGMAAMVAALRPDVDHSDEYVRNTTAHALAVVATALGIGAVLPFVRAVARSTRAWQARQTGARAVRHIAELARSGVLPHLRALVDSVAGQLGDENQIVRTAAALALAALAEAAAPYGIESFDSVLRPLWMGVRQHRGRGLAAFLKAVGFIIPLMDPEHQAHYAREVVPVLIREFDSADDAMRAVVLRVLRQCIGAAGVPVSLVRDDVLPAFARAFWVRRVALDVRQRVLVLDATAELAAKTGAASVIELLIPLLKDAAAPLRSMSAAAVARVLDELGGLDIHGRLEELLIDATLFAFQEQAGDARSALDALASAVTALGPRARPYLQQIASALLWRLNNAQPPVRQQAADLVARIAPAMAACDETEMLSRVSIVLFEYLGEEYPDVLGSILSALRAVVASVGIAEMQPPVGDLLPRLTPILKNRHEKVQEACIHLVGCIADRAPEQVPAREWMRCCFSLLDLLRAHKKAVRRAAVSTFGFIARAIGPQDVLATLLNNLKVQERQNRVCTTVAIAIVAESCAPFTVLPALMNEYRVPELNVQNGVLKSLAFLFEYIGSMARDYVGAVTPLLEDALVDRDLVHRQQAASAIRHLALSVAGRGCEPPILHLLNFLWPNVFETSPHSICAVLEAIESCRVCLGAGPILLYCLQGLFHPARKVREVYWRIYNMMYLGAQPALVAFYPRFQDQAENNYCRY